MKIWKKSQLALFSVNNSWMAIVWFFVGLAMTTFFLIAMWMIKIKNKETRRKN